MDEGVREDLGQLLFLLDLLPGRGQEGHQAGIVHRFDRCDAVLDRRHEGEPLGFARERPADLLGPDRELVLAQRLPQLDLGRRRVALVDGRVDGGDHG